MRAYHGITSAWASLTGLVNNDRDFDLPIDRVLHTDSRPLRYANSGESKEDFATRCADALEQLIQKEAGTGCRAMSCADAFNSLRAAARLAVASFAWPAGCSGTPSLRGGEAIWPDRKARPKPRSATLICDHPSDAISHIAGGLLRLTNADGRDGMGAVPSMFESSDATVGRMERRRIAALAQSLLSSSHLPFQAFDAIESVVKAGVVHRFLSRRRRPRARDLVSLAVGPDGWL